MKRRIISKFYPDRADGFISGTDEANTALTDTLLYCSTRVREATQVWFTTL